MESSSYCNTRGFSFIPSQALADLVGADEPGIRFLTGSLMGFPFTVLYHLFIAGQKPFIKHLYFASCGLLVTYFCFGVSAVHSIINVLVSYFTLRLIGGTANSVLVLFLFNMVYLLTSFYQCQDDYYTVDFTTSHSLLCLKSIGLAWDLYDGRNNNDKFASGAKSTSLATCPSILEVFGHTYFYGSFLAGPLLSMKTYKDFVEDKLIDKEAEKKGPSRYWVALKKFTLATFLLWPTILLQKVYPLSYPVSSDYLSASLPQQYFHGIMWMHGFFSKYFLIWYIGDSCVTFVGLSYNGKSEDGSARWDGVKNADLYIYLTGDNAESLLASFSVSTNEWISKYVYRRIRPVCGRTLSVLLTALFVGIWHGVYIGYILAFVSQSLITLVSRTSHSFLYELTGLTFSSLPLPARIPVYVARALFKWCALAFFIFPMGLKTWNRVIVAWSTRFASSFATITLLEAVVLFGAQNRLKRKSVIETKVDQHSNSQKAD